MARSAKAGGKRGAAKVRKRSPLKGRHPKTRPQKALSTSKASQTKSSITDLKKQIERQARELEKARRQQAASSRVLHIIGASPGALTPVFQAIVQNAVELCEAHFGAAFKMEGDLLHLMADFNSGATQRQLLGAMYPMIPNRGHISGRAVLTGAVVQIADIYDDPDYKSVEAKKAGFRSLLAVPLLHKGHAIGSIVIYRTEPGTFTKRQSVILQTFADQAVIAIENARLFDETQEALERQTATADVLNVISRSPTDAAPVFDAIGERAERLCNAEISVVSVLDGELISVAGIRGISNDGVELFLKNFPMALHRQTVTARTIKSGKVVHIADVLSDPSYDNKELAAQTGYRNCLGVPMHDKGHVIGAIFVARSQPGLFSENQVRILQVFSNQAVIAIQNVRLFEQVQARTRDLSESLQQQTATADVLKAISRSAFDLDSVLSTLVASAARLCEAERGLIFLLKDNLYHTSANFGFSPELEAFARANPLPADGKSTTARAGASGSPVQAVDLLADETQGFLAREYQRLGGHRTNLGVPLRRDGETIGVFTLTRQTVRAFTPRQIELVQTFADQAVIAIENSRLLEQVQAKTRDLEESLQQQTATADVLKAISRSAFDLKAVLNALIEAAARLCEADQGTIARQQGQVFVRVATWGFSDEFARMVGVLPVEPDRGSATGRALLERATVHIPNVDRDPEYNFTDAKRLGRFKTIIAVPMLREGTPIGVLSLTRIEERPFTSKQLKLVSTFTDQAAIAIENVRLFEQVQAKTQELSQSLEDLRAAQDRLIQTEKLASLGQLTAGIAHEIKNPLNFVNNFSALSAELVDEMNEVLADARIEAKKREELDEIRQLLKSNLEKVVQHGKRADSIVKNMLLHSRQGVGERRPVDINAMVDESLNLAYHGARAEKTDFNIALERDFDPGAGIADIYPQEITRVLLNVISNGFYAAIRRASEVGNGFEPKLWAATKGRGETVEIRLRDNGTGIPDDVKDKIFNPFFTTKPAGEGTGLGLSMSHDIVVKQHGGTIEVETEVGAFTEFRIVLPRTGTLRTKSGEQE